MTSSLETIHPEPEADVQNRPLSRTGDWLDAIAAGAWGEAEMAELQAAHAEMGRAIAGGELAVEADARFHRAVARATRNPYYASVQHSLVANIKVGMTLARNLSLLKPSARSQIVQGEHEEVVAAIEARDAETAGAARARHIASARRRMFEGTPSD